MNARQKAASLELLRRASELGHRTSESYTPVSVVCRCTCGWSTSVTRRQNALARAAKCARACHEHEREVVARGQASLP